MSEQLRGASVRVYMVGERTSFYRSIQESAAHDEPRVELIGFARREVPDLQTLAPDAIVVEAPTEDVALRLLTDIARQGLSSKVFLISPHDEVAWIQQVLSLGVHYCLLKPIDPATLLRRIVQITTSLAQPHNPHFLHEHRRWTREQAIVKLLTQLGMPAHYKGFSYLKTAIALAAEDETILGQLTRDLYPLVAKWYRVSPAHVERSMRHAIETTWSRGDMQHINFLFAYGIDQDKGKPTNGLFIARLADHLRLTAQQTPPA